MRGLSFVSLDEKWVSLHVLQGGFQKDLAAAKSGMRNAIIIMISESGTVG